MAEVFEKYIKTNKTIFKYAKGRSVESGKEFHVYHEIILFLDGDAEFISEDIHLPIKPGTLLVIPKETYHQIIIHGNHENYCRCVIHFHDSPEFLDFFCEKKLSQAIIAADKDIRFLFDKLINASRENGNKILDAALTLLFNEIAEKSNVFASENIQNLYVKHAVDYINHNINQKITINEIAKECMISPSSLSHVFKKEMNIPLHKFIIKKRLINAYHRIMSGEATTTVAIECGFNDYSGFYKQYKKMFNVTPSQKVTGFNKS